MGHMPFSQPLAEVTRKYKIAVLHIIRDPRDVVVSHVHEVMNSSEHRLHDFYTQELRCFDERLMASINGLAVESSPSAQAMPSIADRLNMVLPWLNVAECCTVRFEDLVGDRGGGSSESQCTQVLRVADHLGLSLTQEEALCIGHSLFGTESKTFRRGKRGTWLEHFTESHKVRFLELAASQLITLGYEYNENW